MASQATKIPDGKGGWTEISGEVLAGRIADKEKQEAALKKQFYDEAGELTERLLKFDFLHIKENGLSKEHRAFAAALYCINLRENYPDGAVAFDLIAAEAAAYYDENAPKKVQK